MSTWPDDHHVGRSWTAHPLEDACPCPQEPCGLVALSKVDPECQQHAGAAAKTFRQSHRAEDCPAKPPGEALEPVPLALLAEAIRDEAWIDVVLLEVGIVRRVKPLKLVCHRAGDDVEVVQAWPEGNTVNHTNHTFDTDLLIKVRPTQVALLDVKPLVEPEPPAPANSPSSFEGAQIVHEIIRTVAWVNADVTEDDLRKPLDTKDGSYRALRPRQKAMWLAFEMTNLSPEAICKEYFGYQSATPLITVSEKVRWCFEHNSPVIHGERPRAWVNSVKELAKLIDTHFTVKYRRETPHGYNPTWKTFL